MSGSAFKAILIGMLASAGLADAQSAEAAAGPALQGAKAYFSSRADGSDTTHLYAGLESRLYLVVEAEELPPGMHPKATLVTGRSVADDVPDMETVILTRMDGKRYAAAIMVDRKPLFAPGDGKLNLEFGDVIIGTYQSPLDPQARAEANAEFGYYPALGTASDLH
jgi:hypothetical protein